MNMAKVTATKTETTYNLELTEEEANVVLEALTAVSFYDGEGAVAERVYDAFLDAGVEGDGYSHIAEDGEVVITKDEE
jgi:hypothetical protein